MDNKTQSIKCNKCGKFFKAEYGICPFCGADPKDSINNKNNTVGVIKDVTTDSKKISSSEQQTSASVYLPNFVKKNIQKLRLILIVIASIILLIIITVVSTSNDYEKFEYTKGTFEDNIYKNEWANIKLNAPAGYTEGSKYDYANYTGDIAECGLYLESKTGSMYGIYVIRFVDANLGIGGENADYYINFSEYSLLDSIERSYRSTYGNNAEAIEFEEIEIAGEEYVSAHFKENISINSTYYEYVRSHYVRKIDDKFCDIIIDGSTKEENDALVKRIETLYESY